MTGTSSAYSMYLIIKLYLNKNIFSLEKWGGGAVPPENEVENAISTLEENISCGYDGISPKILRKISYHIVKPLTYIFNQSFLNGSIPALITSTFKANNKEQIIVY